MKYWYYIDPDPELRHTHVMRVPAGYSPGGSWRRVNRRDAGHVITQRVLGTPLSQWGWDYTGVFGRYGGIPYQCEERYTRL